MPRKLKDTKIAYWKKGSTWYDDIGIAHQGSPEKVADLWAHVDSRNFKVRVAAGVTWDLDFIDVTFTRGLFEVHMNDFIQIGKRYFKVKEINHGEHRKGTDVTLGCQDSTYEEMLEAD